MGAIDVRRAEHQDAETLVSFNCRLAEETEGKQLDTEIVRAGVEAVLNDPAKGRYFVACRGSRIIGQLMHTWEWSDWRNGEIWWLQSVYVSPHERRQGVFRQLYRHVLQEARQDGNVVALRLYVDGDNRRAQQSYHRVGMRQPGYVVMEHEFAEESS